ncbi:GNAT family N-acetyltransferase [Pseudonocardia sp. NPDC046786]|uniref:GNAT family N-acetyltransferase n=1 Tax=Pseudonocardia sp. NPDC046786 TaxID=3155471 RepID=UPI00340B5D7E
MSSRQIRRAAARDIEDVVRLRAEMFRAMEVSQHDATDWQAAAAEWLTRRLDDPRFCVMVVEVGGAVVATAMGILREAPPSPHSPGGDVLVCNVCTDPEVRGQGHGRAAFDAVLAWSRTVGAGRAELLATEDGRRMYEKAGFRVSRSPVMRVHLQDEGLAGPTLPGGAATSADQVPGGPHRHEAPSRGLPKLGD